MLRSLKELKRYTVTATDGDVGTVVKFLFDDERWAIRYLVVHTGGFFDGQYVLISPISFVRSTGQPTRSTSPSRRTRSRTPRASIPTDPSPASTSETTTSIMVIPNIGGTWSRGVWATTRRCWRQGPGAARQTSRPPGTRGTPIFGAPRRFAGTTSRGETTGSASSKTSSSTMRRGRCATWWSTPATGGGVTGCWSRPAGRAGSAGRTRKVFVSLSREAIKKSPSWDPSSVIRRDYEARLHDFHGLRGYWGEAISGG